MKGFEIKAFFSMTKARRLRLRGPKSRLERFLTWKKGPLTTERLAIFLIIVLCYINAQMILAIYNENNYIEQEENNLPHIGKEAIKRGGGGAMTSFGDLGN